MHLLSPPHIKSILLVGELCNYNCVTERITHDLNSPVTVVARGGSAASEGTVAGNDGRSGVQ